MINLDKTHQIADIIHGTIPYSGLESAIINTPIFNRLHHILQSSLVGCTFSSNKVKRFEHSLGVMHLAGQIFYQSLNNVGDSELINSLLDDCNKEIADWIDNVDFSSERALDVHLSDSCDRDTIFSCPVPDSSIYRENLPRFISDIHKYSYLVLFQAIRIAGLLHDVGHLPYSHIFEHATQQLYNMVCSLKNKNKAQQEFLEILDPYCSKNATKELHEEIGINLVKQIKKEITEELLQESSEKNFYVLIVFDFVIKILSAKDDENTIYSDLHKIIAGVLDADRLDYCSRDLFCSGMQKDIFPYNRLLSSYKLIEKRQSYDLDDEICRNRILFCPSVKNVSLAEELIEKRWKINSSINFHHRVHKHESIFTEILAEIGFNELEKKVNGLNELRAGEPLPLELSSIWQLVKKLQINNSLIDYFIIQLDDGWLDTLLKHEFFAKYTKDYRNKKKYSMDSQWNKFDELISSSKHYYSAFKRSTDFRQLDYELGNAIIECIKKRKSADSYANIVTTIISLNNSKNSNKNVSLNISKIISTVLSSSIAEFFKDIENDLNKYLLSKSGKALNITDCMIRHCKFSIGFKEDAPVYFWKEDNSCVLFEEASLIRQLLVARQGACLPFHLYYLPTNSIENVRFDLLAKKLIEITAQKICELIEQIDSIDNYKKNSIDG